MQAGSARTVPPGRASAGAELVDRDRQVAAVRGAVAAAEAGAGRGVLIEGAAGLGKTSLLAVGVLEARARGLQVLHARGDELEQDFAWGVAVQLYTAVDAADDDLLTGAARLARPLLRGAAAPPETADPFALLHGLHWLTAGLAERRPVLLVVDDAHHSDAESLRLLCYLLRRIEGQPVSALVAARPEPSAADEVRQLLARVALDPAVEVHRLQPLAAPAIAGLVRAALPGADEAFSGAVAHAVAGNPYLCREVLTAVAQEGITPTADGVHRLARLTPAGLRSTVLVRLGQLGDDAARLAVAVAVLGADARPDVAVRAAALTASAGAAALDRLVAADLLAAGEGLAFVHPIVREAVLADLGPARRQAAHLAAAVALHEAGEVPPTHVANHLLAGPTTAAPGWAVDVLRTAAAVHLGQGAPDRAADLLAKAVQLGADPAVTVALQLELGHAEAAAGRHGAVERFRTAARQVTAAPADAQIAVQLGEALYASGRFAEAATAFEDGLQLWEVAAPDVRDDVTEARLLAGLSTAALMLARRPPRVRDRMAAVVARPPASPTPAERVLMATAAGEHALAGDLPHDRVLALARAAVAADDLPEALGRVVLEPATSALICADAYAEARAILDGVIAAASGRGQGALYAALLPIRGFSHLFAGRLADAAADAADAIRLADEVPTASPQAVAPARAVLAVASLRRGDRDEAQAAVAVDDAAQRWGGSPLLGWFLDAVGRVRLTHGEHAEAAAAFLAAGEQFTAGGGPGVFATWRSGAALACARAGDRDRAHELVTDELALAEAYGAPRPLATALRTAALIAADDEARVGLLDRAVATLETSEARWDHARCLVDLDAALRRLGRRRAGRERLRAGLDLARRCGATPLAERAAEELEAAGAQRPRMAVTGVAALTPSELRVARLAADGLGNREIAEALFVTRKTVEVHLSAAYRKLGIAARADLQSALRDDG